MSENITKIEHNMHETLRNGSYNDFQMLFAEYRVIGAHSQKYLYFESLILLYYLAIDDFVKYFELVQCLSQKDLENEFIKFVLDIEDKIYQCEFSKIENMGDGQVEFENILHLLVDNQKKSHEDLLKIDLNVNSIGKNKERSDLQNFDDYLFVCKNYLDLQ